MHKLVPITMMALPLAMALLVSGCADKKKCLEACGTAHHEAVTQCSGDDEAKAACEEKVDETHAQCEEACEKQ